MKYTAKQIKDWDTTTRNKKGYWVPARPYYSAPSILKRLKLSYGVLTNKYDVLDWED